MKIEVGMRFKSATTPNSGDIWTVRSVSFVNNKVSFSWENKDEEKSSKVAWGFDSIEDLLIKIDEPKFKVGDRVRCIWKQGGSSRYNQLGVMEEPDDDGGKVLFDNGDIANLFARSLELIEDDPPRVQKFVFFPAEGIEHGMCDCGRAMSAMFTSTYCPVCDGK